MTGIKLIANDQPVKVHPVALIGGDGRSLPDDVAAFSAFDIPHDIFSIGRSISFFPAIDHWANVDSGEAIWWAEHLPNKWRTKPQRHTLGYCRGFDYAWEIPQCDYDIADIMWHGSTALFCVHVALEMGYTHVVLAGCPLDAAGHWYYPAEIKGPRWTGETYQAWLDFSTTEDAKKVRSMSGYTAIMVGDPDIAWLSSPQK